MFCQSLLEVLIIQLSFASSLEFVPYIRIPFINGIHFFFCGNILMCKYDWVFIPCLLCFPVSFTSSFVTWTQTCNIYCAQILKFLISQWKICNIENLHNSCSNIENLHVKQFKSPWFCWKMERINTNLFFL